jgi:hypothetical protein
VADLLARIDANDRLIEYINTSARPRDAARLLGTELVARELDGFVQAGTNAARVNQELRLPAFVPSKASAFLYQVMASEEYPFTALRVAQARPRKLSTIARGH